MSQWKFNNFETDIDFTDADFMEKFEGCYEKMVEERNVKFLMIFMIDYSETERVEKCFSVRTAWT